MRFLWMIVLVIPLLTYYTITLLIGAGWRYLYVGRCPHCNHLGLRQGDFIEKAPRSESDQPDRWWDYQCRSCGTVVRWHRDQWEYVSGTAILVNGRTRSA